jgi:hypothetical protein
MGDIYENYAAIAAAAASNLTFGTNPAYGISDFLAVYPQFGPSDYFGSDGSVNAASSASWPLPEAVLRVFINLASASLSADRWGDAWSMGMALFVAHFTTLHLQTSSVAPGSAAAQVAGAGLAKGVLVSKSAGDVSGSFESVVADVDGWAAWKLTVFGQQLLTMGRLTGMGGMYVY